jgi:hypothetical protein
MTVTWSAAVRNTMIDAWETAIGGTPFLRIYTGAPPAHTADAQTGTLLAEYHLGANWADDAAGGVKALAALSLPLTTVGLALGNAGHYVIVATDGVTTHERGTVTASGGGGDATIDNVSIAIGQTVKVTSFQKTMPGA